MSKEILLPAHLYDRIKASAGEHGGIGWGQLFDGGLEPDGGPNRWFGTPLCAHGHAWGTCTRYNASPERTSISYHEPELLPHLTYFENDDPLWRFGLMVGERIPFTQWCELLNVKRVPDTPAPEKQSVESLEAVSA